jgi:holo-[acyl-carrier protein] synthase
VRGVVVGLGVDLIELDRVRLSYERWGERLVGRLMDPEEARALPADAVARAEALAFAVAAKEAASKAIGTGWSRGVRWRDVVLTRDPSARVALRGRASEVARRLGWTGATRVRLFVDGNLVIGEVWLLG